MWRSDPRRNLLIQMRWKTGTHHDVRVDAEGGRLAGALRQRLDVPARLHCEAVAVRDVRHHLLAHTATVVGAVPLRPGASVLRC